MSYNENPKKLYGSLSWENILEGRNVDMGKDLMIQILTKYYHLELKENPFPLTKVVKNLGIKPVIFFWNWERSEIEEFL